MQPLQKIKIIDIKNSVRELKNSTDKRRKLLAKKNQNSGYIECPFSFLRTSLH